MIFTHKKAEKKLVNETTETYEAEIAGFDVIFEPDGNHGATLHICPCNLTDFPIGILRLHPRSVAALERFSSEAGPLFSCIAKALLELGFDDLRSEFDKMTDKVAANNRIEAEVK